MSEGTARPKAAGNKSRSSQNARRYAFTLRAAPGEAERERLANLQQAFLGDRAASAELLELAAEAAEAQHRLDLIRQHKLTLLREAEINAALFRGPEIRSDRALLRHALEERERGRVVAGVAMAEMRHRQSRLPPRDPVRRHIELYAALAPELERLERYEDAALVRRRKAVRALAAVR